MLFLSIAALFAILLPYAYSAPALTLERFDWDQMDTLPPELVNTILETTMNPKDMASLSISSKRLKETLQNLDIGKHVWFGTKEKPVDDPSACGLFIAKPSLMRQIRYMYVSSSVFDKCGFAASKLPNLKTLVFSHPSSDVKSAEILLPIWISLQSNFPDVKKLEVTGSTGRNLLHHLIYQNDMENILMLVKSGLVDVNWQDPNGLTPLHRCFIPDLLYLLPNSVVNTAKCVETLLSLKANIHLTDKSGMTPVHYAANLYYAEPLNLLLLHGADPNMYSRPADKCLSENDSHPDQNSICSDCGSERSQCYLSVPLHMAILAADTMIHGLVLHSPFEILGEETDLVVNAKEHDPHYWHKVLADNKSNKNLPYHSLLRAGADLFVQSHHRNGLTWVLMMSEPGPMLRDMLDMVPANRIPITVPDSHGDTPLHHAATLVPIDVVSTMISLGADLNAQNQDGHTPLHVACRSRGTAEFIGLMMSSDANPNIPDRLGRLPIHHLFDNHPEPDVVLEILHPQIRLDILDTNRSPSSLKSSPLSKIINLAFRKEDMLEDSASVLIMMAALIRVLVTQLNQTRPPRFEDVDFHYLLIAVLSPSGVDLFNDAREAIPPRILNTLKYPHFNENGLVIEPGALEQFIAPYVAISDAEPHFMTKCWVMKRSPWIYSHVRHVKMTPQSLQKCEFKLSPQVTHVDFSGSPYWPSSLDEPDVPLFDLFPNAEIKTPKTTIYPRSRMNSVEFSPHR